MFDALPDQLPWYLAGPALGILVAVLFAVANQPLGASGAYVQTSGLLRRRDGITKWRVWYFVGMFVGGVLVTQVLRTNSPVRSGYDALRDALPLVAVVPLVFGGSVLLGYGAGLAGGCTSGHGLCGTSQRSKASVVVTTTFMTSAIITTLVLELITAGAL